MTAVSDHPGARGPSFLVRVDLGARYCFKVEQREVTLRANLENVANEDYWASTIGGYLTQGEPRTLRVSATVDF